MSEGKTGRFARRPLKIASKEKSVNPTLKKVLIYTGVVLVTLSLSAVIFGTGWFNWLPIIGAKKTTPAS